MTCLSPSSPYPLVPGPSSSLLRRAVPRIARAEDSEPDNPGAERCGNERAGPGGLPASGPHGPGASRGRRADGPDARPAERAGPPPDLVTMEVDVSRGTTTVFISGELDLVTMPVLAEHVTQVLGREPRRLILDMAETRFMDCGCARVIRTAAQSRPEGQRLIIRRPGPGVRRVLELTGLDAYCDIQE
jgi:anti-anti-sigma factor